MDTTLPQSSWLMTAVTGLVGTRVAPVDVPTGPFVAEPDLPLLLCSAWRSGLHGDGVLAVWGKGDCPGDGIECSLGSSMTK